MNILDAAVAVAKLREFEVTAARIHGADWDRTFANLRTILQCGPQGKGGVLSEGIRRAKLARSTGETITWLGAASRAIRTEDGE